jgi:hypothetical protein
VTVAALLIVAGVVLLYAGIRGYKVSKLLTGKLVASSSTGLLS